MRKWDREKGQMKQKPNYRGEVQEVFADKKFQVKILINGAEEPVLCFAAGKLLKNKIKIIPGDRVAVYLEKIGGLGRIDYRL